MTRSDSPPAPAPAAAFLRGERVYLRALAPGDADGPYVGWLNSDEVCRGNSHHVLPYTREKALEYIRHAATTEHELILAVVVRAGDRHVGNVSLSRVNARAGTAEFNILMGDRDYWGKGYAAEAARLLLAHAFGAMNLQRVGCGTFATNGAMRKLAASLGMREEGVRRRAAWKDGAYVDVVEFGLLREEFGRA